MKKNMTLIMATLIIGLIMTGCSDSKDNKSNDENKDNVSTDSGKNQNQEDKAEKKEIYQIGETAKTKSNSYEFPYEVTVNSFKLTTDDVEGYSLEDFNFEAADGGKFALVNITIKNDSDEPFVPKDTISGSLTSEIIDIPSDDEFFKEREKELKPGEEIKGNLVFISESFYELDKIYLVFEEVSNDEIKFELPIPKK